jgi:catechol 2,3-dioxygenase-like lactoylglutathione lyase family enzyme
MKPRAHSWTILSYTTVPRAADAREGSGAVEPRLSLVTLGVHDLTRSVAFYRDGLGWPKSELGGDEVAFFKTGGAIIALFPRTSFAADAGINVEDVEHSGFSRFSLAHNVAEEEGVDLVLAEAAAAGATIVKEAQEIFFGRHGFFADPDGFLWEVAWNPSFPMATDGSIELPE